MRTDTNDSHVVRNFADRARRGWAERHCEERRERICLQQILISGSADFHEGGSGCLRYGEDAKNDHSFHEKRFRLGTKCGRIQEVVRKNFKLNCPCLNLFLTNLQVLQPYWRPTGPRGWIRRGRRAINPNLPKTINPRFVSSAEATKI